MNIENEEQIKNFADAEKAMEASEHAGTLLDMHFAVARESTVGYSLVVFDSATGIVTGVTNMPNELALDMMQQAAIRLQRLIDSTSGVKH